MGNDRDNAQGRFLVWQTLSFSLIKDRVGECSAWSYGKEEIVHRTLCEWLCSNICFTHNVYTADDSKGPNHVIAGGQTVLAMDDTSAHPP